MWLMQSLALALAALLLVGFYLGRPRGVTGSITDTA
jgi:hypothetical protein